MDKFSAQIAAILWDAVFGLQVAAWAAGDPEDYRLWTKGERSGSVLDSDYANAVGVTHWLEIDRVIKESSEFRGQKDTDIYQVRPAIFALRELASNDET